MESGTGQAMRRPGKQMLKPSETDHGVPCLGARAYGAKACQWHSKSDRFECGRCINKLERAAKEEAGQGIYQRQQEKLLYTAKQRRVKDT